MSDPYARLDFVVRKNEDWIDPLPRAVFQALFNPQTIEGQTLLMEVKNASGNPLLSISVASGYLHIRDAQRCRATIVVPISALKLIPDGTFSTDMVATEVSTGVTRVVFVGSVKFERGTSEAGT